jgi:class 3 adenylate cyclase/pimeloyl-ACP methyl ester carboxylesterase
MSTERAYAGAVGDTRYAKSSDSTHIAYQVEGEGPVDLIEVPGFVSNVEVYTTSPFYAVPQQRLTRFARWIRIDKRGTGLSDRVLGAPSLEQRMDDVRAVMDAVGSERAFLYGISEGGPMCLLFAATYPERTLGLIILGSFARMFESPDYECGLPLALLDPILDGFEDHWGDGSSLTAFVPNYIKNHPDRVESLAAYERQSASPGAVKEILGLLRDIDVRAVLPTITVPTLVVHATRDPMIPVTLGRYVAERIPHAQLVELPFLDHVFFEPAESEVSLDAIEEFITGSRPIHDAAPDRILSTVLFTDIVDSTARASELGDRRWREILDRHDDVCREHVARFRGREVKQTGDGFLAAFDGPARAVQCGLAVSDAIRPLGVEIRAGVHTGECEQRGEDLGGIAVHIGARVAGLAGPGEVLVSRTVKDLVAGSGLRFDDRGEHTLKGVPDAWQLYAAAV